MVAQREPEDWPELRERFTVLFKTRTRDEWCELLEGSDACFAPVLPMTEAAQHPHIRARQTIVDYDGVLQPAPAPRFSRTKPQITSSRATPGEHTDAVLNEWGFAGDELLRLRELGAIR
jgi:alpha-methylacyl-CoA racemase